MLVIKRRLNMRLARLTASNLFGELGKISDINNIYGFEWNWSQFFHFMKQDFIWEHVQPALDFFFPDERCEHKEWRSPTESCQRRSRPSLPDYPRGSGGNQIRGWGSSCNKLLWMLQPKLSMGINSQELIHIRDFICGHLWVSSSILGNCIPRVF